MKESAYNIWRQRDSAAFVYNGVTGALLRLETGDRAQLDDFLSRGAAADCAPDLLVRLAQGGMIVEDETDEVALLSRRYESARKRSDILGLTVVTSLGCNLDCPYCYQKKHPEILNARVRAGLTALAEDRLANGAKALSVTWFGGEPLVGKKPLYALSEIFLQLTAEAGAQYDADIVTNGYMLDARVAGELKALGVRAAQVTLDGPEDLHDINRPQVGGGGSYRRIVANLTEAADHLPIQVRVNIDTGNADGYARLLEDLAAAGLSRRISVYPAQIVGISMNADAPSASYGKRCFSKTEFSEVELGLMRLTREMGFAAPSLPQPAGAPCTAVRDHELVVGSSGELYKCWYDVGNPAEVIGNIADYTRLNGRVRRWLSYDPFANPDCRGCIALPVCMGGCAAHALDPQSYDDRCGTFRAAHRQQVDAFIDAATA